MAQQGVIDHVLDCCASTLGVHPDRPYLFTPLLAEIGVSREVGRRRITDNRLQIPANESALPHC